VYILYIQVLEEVGRNILHNIFEYSHFQFLFVILIFTRTFGTQIWKFMELRMASYSSFEYFEFEFLGNLKTGIRSGQTTWFWRVQQNRKTVGISCAKLCTTSYPSLQMHKLLTSQQGVCVNKFIGGVQFTSSRKVQHPVRWSDKKIVEERSAIDKWGVPSIATVSYKYHFSRV